MKHIFFSILTVLAFWHCQDPAPTPKNTLNCYVRFDAVAQSIKAEASLFDGLTNRVIESPGGIRFQTTQMKPFPVRGITYTVEYAARHVEKPAFEWKDKKGEPVKFDLELPIIDSFFFQSPVLSLEESAMLRWSGKPLGKGETLVFIWENVSSGQTESMEVSTTLGQPLIEIPPAKLAKLGAGTWSLYLVRRHLNKVELADFWVESTAEYYTKSKTLRLE
jgi:hypothetical protein